MEAKRTNIHPLFSCQPMSLNLAGHVQFQDVGGLFEGEPTENMQGKAISASEPGSNRA
jgi:hypothetical protein